ncbi:hypothetical protein ACFX1T_001294 [Malus domestica]
MDVLTAKPRGTLGPGASSHTPRISTCAVDDRSPLPVLRSYACKSILKCKLVSKNDRDDIKNNSASSSAVMWGIPLLGNDEKADVVLFKFLRAMGSCCGKISGGALPPRDADDTFSKPVSGSDEPQQGGWLRVFSGAFLTPTTLKLVCTNGPSSKNQNSSFQFLNGFFSFSSRWPFLAQKLPVRIGRSVIVFAKKNINKEKKKEDNHNFASKPDEATEPFPESMLLKQKKVQEDGNLLPKFADAEEDKVYEFLKLQLQKRFE